MPAHSRDIRHAPTTQPDPRLTRSLWQLLILAALALLLLPAARGQSLIGYLPLWLLTLPTSALLVAYRDRLMRTRT